MDVVYLVVDFASGHIVSLVAPIPIIDQMNSFHIRLRAFNQDCERGRKTSKWRKTCYKSVHSRNLKFGVALCGLKRIIPIFK